MRYDAVKGITTVAQQILEGTWEEIAAHAGELAGKRLRVIVEMDAPEAVKQPNVGPPNMGPPNEQMLGILRDIAERQEGRRETGGDSVADVRYGRSGPMYGMPFVDDMGIQPDDD